MDTQLLLAFITAVEQQSFSLAADKLSLTQSAVSKRISLLEQSLGHPVFDRIGRRIYLTEAGTALLPRARRILREIDDTKRFMRDLTGDVSGCLRIATSHHIGLHRLPPVLTRFIAQYPKVHLQLKFIDSEQAVEAIAHGDYDLALITLADNIANNSLDSIQSYCLWQDPMFFVTNHQHPLSQQKQVQLSDLAKYSAILPDPTTYTTALVQQLFTQHQQVLDISMTTNHLDAIKMMIAVGLGWSLLPKTLISDTLVKLPVNNSALSRQLGCIFQRERTLSNAARAMVKCLRTAASNTASSQ